MGACCCANEGCGPMTEAALTFLKNSAFVFIKPHAISQAVVDLVLDIFTSSGIKAVQCGVIDAMTIEQRKLIDLHYGVIASRALKQDPSDILLNTDAQQLFARVFGISWDKALLNGSMFNAVGAAKHLNIDPLMLGDRFQKLKVGVDKAKLGRGLYVGKIDGIYVVNGFYTKMRKTITNPFSCIHYFEVEWNASLMSWSRFRVEIIGLTDPKEAVSGSIRNSIYKQWKSLDMEAQPDIGDNGVHASASPLEALVEKRNWMSANLANDSFGKALLAAGLGLEKIQFLMSDPPVLHNNKRQYLFDVVEDMDAPLCIDTVLDITSQEAFEGIYLT